MPKPTLAELLTQYRAAKSKEVETGSVNTSLESNLIAQAITGYQITADNWDELRSAIENCYQDRDLIAQLISNICQTSPELLENERNYVSLMGDRETYRPIHKLFSAAIAKEQFSLAALLYEKSTVKPAIPQEHLLAHIKALRHALEIKDDITMGYIFGYVKSLHLDQKLLFSTISSQVDFHRNTNMLSEVVPKYYSLAQVLDTHVDDPSYAVWVSIFHQATPSDFKACADFLTRFPDAAFSEILFAKEMPGEVLRGIWGHLSPQASNTIFKSMIIECSKNVSTEFLEKILKFELFNPSPEQYEEFCDIAFSNAVSPQDIEERNLLFNSIRELSPKAENKANLLARLLKGDFPPAEVASLINEIDIEDYVKSRLASKRYSHLDGLLSVVKEILSDDTKQLIVQKAMFLKKPDLLQICIDNQFDLNKPFTGTQYQGRTPLEKAVLKGNLGHVEKLIKAKGNIDVNRVFSSEVDNENKASALSYCMESKYFDLADLLLNRSDIDAGVPDNKPFLEAIRHKQFQLAQKIYEKSATKPLLTALITKHPTIFGLDVFFSDSMSIATLEGIWKNLSPEVSTPILSQFLKECAKNKNYDLLSRVLKLKPFDPSADEYDKLYSSSFAFVATPAETQTLNEIFNAFRKPSDKGIKTGELIAKMATTVDLPVQDDEIASDIDHKSYVEAAIALERIEYLGRIIPMVVDKIDDSCKKLILDAALDTDNADLLKVCVDNQFDLSNHEQDELTLLERALSRRDKTAVSLASDPNIQLALLRNSSRAHAKILLAVDRDIDVNHLFKIDLAIPDGDTPLSYCIRNGYLDLVELLLKRNDIDVCIYDNKAFYVAFDNNQFKLAMEIAEKSHGKLNIPVEKASRCIRQAISGLDLKALECILSLTANVNMTNPNLLRLAVLHAIEKGFFEGVEFLLTKGVDVSRHSDLLQKALESPNPNLKIVQALIDSGANPASANYSLPLLAFNQFQSTQDPTHLEIAKLLLMNLTSQSQEMRDKINDIFTDIQLGKVEAVVAEKTITDFIKSGMNPVQAYAFDYLQVYTERRRRQIESESESSMALTARANKHFEETIKPAVKAQFEQVKGATDMQKVATIERDIKAFLLDTIISNCKLLNDSQSRKMLAFIDDNRVALIEGKDQDVLAQMRAFTSNNDAAHLAWRAYDPYVTRDPVWEPLLCSTKGSDASHTARARVAMVFLANPDPTTFIAQLADMERAPGHSANTDTVDSFTCFPGAVGRIARMGENHPTLQLPPSRTEMREQFIEKFIFKHYDDKMKTLNEDDQEALCYALTGLTPNTAIDIINDKSNQRFPQEWLKARQQFIAELGDLNNIVEQLNKEYISAGEEPLSATERYYVECDFNDIGGSGRNASLIAAYEKMAPREEHQPVDAKTPSAMVNPFSFSFVDTKLPPSHNINKIRKYIEFELLYPPLEHFFAQKGVAEETLVEWLKSFINEASSKAGEPQDPKEKFKTELDQFLQTDEQLASLQREEQGKLKELMFDASFVNGIPAANATAISTKLSREIVPKEDQPEKNKEQAALLMKKVVAALAAVAPAIKVEEIKGKSAQVQVETHEAPKPRMGSSSSSSAR